MISTIHTRIEPCQWHDSRVSVSFEAGFPLSLSWSPSGAALAVTMYADGVWLLSLSDYRLAQVLSEPRRCWFRPTWGSDDHVLFVNSPDGGTELRLDGDTWGEVRPLPRRWVRWAEPLEGSGWIGIEHSEGSLPTLVSGEDPFTSTLVTHPYLPDGRPLDVWIGEYPTWWIPGESVIVVAHTGNGMQTFSVRIHTGESELWMPEDASLPDGVCHSLTRSVAAPFVAGISASDPSLFPGQKTERLFRLHQHLGVVQDLGMVPVRYCGSPVAISPMGDSIAVIDGVDSISILGGL